MLLATLALLAGCGGGNPATPTAPITFASHSSAHFTFRYTPLDAASVASTADAVEGHHARILGDLGVSQIPSVTVTLYPDQESFRAAVVPLTERRHHAGAGPS